MSITKITIDLTFRFKKSRETRRHLLGMGLMIQHLGSQRFQSPWHQSREKKAHVTMIFKDREEATMTYTAHISCDREYHDWSGMEIFAPREEKLKKAFKAGENAIWPPAHKILIGDMIDIALLSLDNAS